mgnify:CR=1 FL=1
MTQLQDHPIDIKIQLALMWTSLMFCYIYCDYFDLYTPDKIKEMLELKSMLDSSWKLQAASVLMTIPCLMIYLSVSLRPEIYRALNMGFGIFYALFLTLILFSLDLDWYKFYVLFAVIEVVLAILIVRKAHFWPVIRS